MAAEMRKSYRDEDHWTAVVTGTRRRPLYCCWTTMRTLSHFPRGLWEKTCHFCFKILLCQQTFFLFSFMPLIVSNTQIFFLLNSLLQLEPCVQILQNTAVGRCFCMNMWLLAMQCVCSRGTCMSDRIVCFVMCPGAELMLGLSDSATQEFCIKISASQKREKLESLYFQKGLPFSLL